METYRTTVGQLLDDCWITVERLVENRWTIVGKRLDDVGQRLKELVDDLVDELEAALGDEAGDDLVDELEDELKYRKPGPPHF